MRKILTVALLASTLATPVLAADLTPAVNSGAATVAPAAKPAMTVKSEKKAVHKHMAHKAKKPAKTTM